MGFANAYLRKHANPDKLISKEPSENLRYVVIIPAYKESGLIQSLDSFLLCELPEYDIEIISLINWPENASTIIKEENHSIFSESVKWAEQNSRKGMRFHCLELPDMPEKHAGVGLARKVLMDEAVRRFEAINCDEGIIISFDADCTYKKNFFRALEDHYSSHPQISGCNIYFEHRLKDEKIPGDARDGIAFYELHLRYYLQALRRTGHPNVFHTVGSSFSVKAKAYCSQGGMNKRQAGEDFYFLQKLFDLGNFSECNKTAVYPSARPSDRVPFGTGPVISQYLKNKSELMTYDPHLFKILELFIKHIPGFYTTENINKTISLFPEIMQEFLLKEGFIQKLEEIRINSSCPESFTKRFFRWFNMFRMLKFLNYGKKSFPEVPIRKAAQILAFEMEYSGRDVFSDMGPDHFELLEFYRNMEKEF